MNKPLLTFALLTYNQEAFVRDAVRGALLQDYAPLEIIITDDCSPDGTFEIVQSEVDNYSGPHVIRLNRNKKNLGIDGQINQIMRMAEGELVVAGAGDDISLPIRTAKIYEKWVESGKKAKSIFSKGLVIDEHGNETGETWEPPYAVSPENYSPSAIALKWAPILGASHAWSRDVYDVFGAMHTPIFQEDCVIPFRSSLLGEIAYIDEPLVKYRQHAQAIWKELHELSNWRVYLDWQYRKSVNHIGVYKNHLAALDVLKEVLPARYAEVADLKTLIERRLAEEVEEVDLFDAPTYLKRAAMLLELILKKGSNKRLLVTYFGQFIIPVIYFQYLQCKYRPGRF